MMLIVVGLGLQDVTWYNVICYHVRFVSTTRQKDGWCGDCCPVHYSGIILICWHVLYSPHLHQVRVPVLDDWFSSIDIHYNWSPFLHRLPSWNLVCSTCRQWWIFKDKYIAAMDGEAVGPSWQLQWGSMGSDGLFNFPPYLCLLTD